MPLCVDYITNGISFGKFSGYNGCMDIQLAIVGLLTGFVSAFFGIGGSSIDTPVLREFLGFPPYLALGTPLPTAFLTIAIALLAYWKSRLVNARIFRWSVLGGLPGIVIGSLLSGRLSGRNLMLLTAFVLFFVGLSFVLKSIRERKHPKAGRSAKSIPPTPIILVSGLAGLASGILANGGGLFLIPAYVIFFRLDIKEAIATSLSVVAVMILPSCLIHYSLGHIDLRSSLMMGLGVLPAAYVGAKLDIRTKSKTVQALFGLVLISFSAYFFVSQI